MKKFSLFLLFVSLWCGVSAQNIIIPKPNKVEFYDGIYALNKDNVYVEDRQIEKDLRKFNIELQF